MKNEISPLFLKGFEKTFGSSFSQKLKLSIEKGRRKSVRFNTLKINSQEIKERLLKKNFLLEQVPWFSDAFFVENKRSFSDAIEHFLGYFFVQDASSLIPPILLEPKPEDFVLDLCSAPGAKTTQIAQMMKNQGVVVANESKRKRILILKSNLQRCGVFNTILFNYDGRLFWKSGLKFDKILVDAPCSGSGTIISNPSISYDLKDGLIKKLTSLQKALLKSAILCLKEKGKIVYSTCSLDPRENEEVIDWAIKEFGVKVEKIEVKGLKNHPGILNFKGKDFSSQIKNCLRIFPFDYQTEGFFLCRLTF